MYFCQFLVWHNACSAPGAEPPFGEWDKYLVGDF